MRFQLVLLEARRPTSCAASCYLEVAGVSGSFDHIVVPLWSTAMNLKRPLSKISCALLIAFSRSSVSSRN